MSNAGQATKTIEPGNANYLKLIVYNKYGDNRKSDQAYLSINASKQYSNHEFFYAEGTTSMGNEEDLDSKSDMQAKDTEIDQDDDTIGRNFMENEVVLPLQGQPQK